MNRKAILAALALTTTATIGATAVPAAAQSWQGNRSWNSTEFWRGAPEGLQQRIDWLQQRIDRGIADGSLDRQEARRAQFQLDQLERDAQVLDRRLDDLSRNLRWSRRDDNWGRPGWGAGGGRWREPYSTDYDAYRYYREDSRYVERRLGPDEEIFRGSDGRYYCKRNDGTTGLVIGAVGGAVVGNVIDGGRNRVAGTLIGGALGALVGKSIDQSNSDVRCR
ncbi:MAG: glycine zipper 2TM domain-containing protein [Novosphingobium sp.]